MEPVNKRGMLMEKLLILGELDHRKVVEETTKLMNVTHPKAYISRSTEICPDTTELKSAVVNTAAERMNG